MDICSKCQRASCVRGCKEFQVLVEDLHKQLSDCESDCDVLASHNIEFQQQLAAEQALRAIKEGYLTQLAAIIPDEFVVAQNTIAEALPRHPQLTRLIRLLRKPKSMGRYMQGMSVKSIHHSIQKQINTCTALLNNARSNQHDSA